MSQKSICTIDHNLCNFDLQKQVIKFMAEEGLSILFYVHNDYNGDLLSQRKYIVCDTELALKYHDDMRDNECYQIENGEDILKELLDSDKENQKRIASKDLEKIFNDFNVPSDREQTQSYLITFTDKSFSYEDVNFLFGNDFDEEESCYSILSDY